jgi:hypothetical protein
MSGHFCRVFMVLAALSWVSILAGCGKNSTSPTAVSPSPAPESPPNERPTNLYGCLQIFGSAKVGLNVRGELALPSNASPTIVPATGIVIFADGDTVLLSGSLDREKYTLHLTSNDWVMDGTVGPNYARGRLTRTNYLYGGWTAILQPEGDSIRVFLGSGHDAQHARTEFDFFLLDGVAVGTLQGGIVYSPPSLQSMRLDGHADAGTGAISFQTAEGDTVLWGFIHPDGTADGHYDAPSYPMGSWSGKAR